MPQKKQNSWDYDSVKAHYSKYRDSVVVDYHYSTEEGWDAVWVHKDADYNITKTQEYDGLSHELQYYIVPGFFALIIAFFIFGSLVMRDNRAAMVRKDKDSILSMMKNDAKKN